MPPLPDVLHAVPDRVWVGFALVFGLCVGSFLNVVIHRLPRDESIVHPSSHCPRCRTPLRWFDNLPLVSYLWLRGRCRGCGARIPLRYPVIELVTGLLFAGVALRFGAVPMTLVGCAFASALVATAAIDFDHQIIPDEISLGGLAVALVVVPATAWQGGDPLSVAVVRSLAGALLGGGMLWIVGFAHARVSAALGRSFEHWPGEGEALPRFGSLDYWTWFPGVGFGDVKLLAMIGAVLGPAGVLETIVLASLVGLAVGALVTLTRRTWNTPFGFAPAIAVGALLALLAPDPLAWLPALQ
jgi:leader peptidase (prepilin peptidase) / N-methyltransferase